jgi:anti-anti-sigma factor
MEISERRLGSLVVLRPEGRIDNTTCAEFQARLLAVVNEGTGDIVVDFAAVDYISSVGLRALMTAARLKGKERRLAATGLNAVVQEVFTISRFHHIVPVVGSVEEAARAWEAPPQAREAPRAPEKDASTISVHFWGTRGSLPAPLGHAAVRAKMRTALLAARGRGLATEAAVDEFIDRELAFSVRGTFGGNTSCVEIATGGEEYLLCDLGSGVREFGNRVMARHGPAQKHTFNFVMSHVHWDHIMGFPFFIPAYIPGNLIRIHGCHSVLREALLRQQSDPCFPVDLRSLGATIEFVELKPGVEYQIAGVSVTPIKQFHAGDSYGYRFSRGGKTIVYSTDCEHKDDIHADYPFVEFFRDADLLIFDAMYSLADSISVKEDWGHSSNIIAVELAQMARVKRLVLFHHEPVFDDSMIEAVFAETRRFEEVSRDGHAVEVISAYDGLELTL